MRTFFTADHHFGHAGIIDMCQRPFKTVGRMNIEMLQRWNDTVAPNDEVWHLGDFAYKMPIPDAEKIFGMLHGKKHLVVGNHDAPAIRSWSWGWESIHDIKEIAIDGRRVIMCHYPLAEWPGYYRDSVHLFGHVHGNRLVAGAVDVGVDNWDFRPVTLDEILAVRTPTPTIGRSLETWERAYIEKAKEEAEARALGDVLQQRVDQAGGR